MNNYSHFRNTLSSNVENIINSEKYCFEKLFTEIVRNSSDIKRDFDKTFDIKNFWCRYAPRQRLAFYHYFPLAK
jgi:Restriction endonuclease BglI